MHDKRVHKGNTYAAMVIPAGAYPDSMQGAANSNTMQDAAHSRTRTMGMTGKKVSKLKHTFSYLLCGPICQIQLASHFS